MAKRRRLKNLADCRRFLAGVANEVRDGELESATGGKLAYIISVIAKCIEGGALEQRLLALEQKLGGK